MYIEYLSKVIEHNKTFLEETMMHALQRGAVKFQLVAVSKFCLHKYVTRG